MEGEERGPERKAVDGPSVDDVLAGAEWQIERAVLNETAEGREIATGFVSVFGAFVTHEMRPIMRRVADEGGEPQLLMNGLAELLRATAEQIEFPLDHPRSGSPGVER